MRAERPQSFSTSKKQKQKPNNNVKVLSKKEMENNGKRKYVHFKIDKQTVSCLLDTGSEISIIDESTWKK